MKGPALTGQVLGGRYQLGEVLGEGGYGAVYAATQTDLGRPVAVKVLHLDAALQTDGIARFEREARAAAALGHPNIAAVTDFQANAGEPPFLVMERLAGHTLGRTLAIAGRLPPQRVAWIAYQMLAALESAHAAGIIHRDVKPENVFLVSMPGVEDLVKLLDFGIAKLVSEGQASLTAEGSMLGSPAYMAPEQVHGTRLDHRVDIYAVGATMYRALSGRFPFDAANVHSLLLAIASPEPAVPLGHVDASIPTTLAAVVERAMQKEPGKRFQTAAEMRAALEPIVNVSGGRPIPSSHGGTAIMSAAPTPGPGVALGVPLGPTQGSASAPVPMPTPAAMPNTGPTPQPHVLGPHTAPSAGIGPMPAPMPMTTPQVQTAPAAPPRGNGAIIALLVVILVVLLGGGAGAAFFFLRQPSTAPSSSPSASSGPSPPSSASGGTTATATSTSAPPSTATVAPGGVVPKGATTKPVGPGPVNPLPDAGVAPPGLPPVVVVVDAGAPPAPGARKPMGGTSPRVNGGTFDVYDPPVGRGIVEGAPGLAKCYIDSEFDPPDHQYLVMTLVVDAAGRVKSVAPKTEASNHPKLTPCIIRSLLATKWPATAKGGVVDVNLFARVSANP